MNQKSILLILSIFISLFNLSLQLPAQYHPNNANSDSDSDTAGRSVITIIHETHGLGVLMPKIKHEVITSTGATASANGGYRREIEPPNAKYPLKNKEQYSHAQLQHSWGNKPVEEAESISGAQYSKFPTKSKTQGQKVIEENETDSDEFEFEDSNEESDEDIDMDVYKPKPKRPLLIHRPSPGRTRKQNHRYVLPGISKVMGFPKIFRSRRRNKPRPEPDSYLPVRPSEPSYEDGILAYSTLPLNYAPVRLSLYEDPMNENYSTSKYGGGKPLGEPFGPEYNIMLEHFHRDTY